MPATHKPQSLIQIHYHNHTSGVSKVMTEYAKIFADITNSPKVNNIIICHDRAKVSKLSTNPYRIISIPDCDYHVFRSKNTFARMCDNIIHQLVMLLEDSSIPKPICLVGHNLSLGKNLALAKAFSVLSIRYRSDSTVRFFSVVHDFAEEGRLKLLRNIDTIESWGVSIWKHLYPYNTVHFVVLNRRNYTLFTQVGFSTSLLPNPIAVTYPLTQCSHKCKGIIKEGLSKLSKMDRTAFDRGKKTMFYPVRIITRKNIVEAIILACFIYKSNIVLGGCGTSRHDKDLYNALIKYAQKYNLPVVCSVDRMVEQFPSSMIQECSLFNWLYFFSDICITTSISEGFGYALYEPWLYGKKVIGRLPNGIGESEIACFTHLYTRCDVPLSWISISQLENEYHGIFKRNNIFSNRRNFHESFLASFIHRGYVDFAVLTQKMQFGILKALCKGGDATEIRFTKGYSLCFQSENVVLDYRYEDQKLIRKNRNRIKKFVVNKSIYKEFKRCFFTEYTFTDNSTNDDHSFQNIFLNFKNFRIITST